MLDLACAVTGLYWFVTSGPVVHCRVVSHLRKRHEDSRCHKEAGKVEQELVALQVCKGLLLSSADGVQTCFGSEQSQIWLDLWLEAGKPCVVGSPLESIKLFKDDQGNLVCRDRQCGADEAAADICLRGRASCKKCLSAASRTKAHGQMRDWAKRISFVDLTHAIMRGKSQQTEHALAMAEIFPELSASHLQHITFSAAVGEVRKQFIHVPTAKQNTGLRKFIDRCVRVLTPTMVLGIDEGIKDQIVRYIDVLSSGKLRPEESSAMVIPSVIQHFVGF